MQNIDLEKRIPEVWKKLLKQEFKKPYFIELNNFVNEEYASKNIFPEKDNIFRALELCSPSDTKVVIIGQDPYHGQGQAHGLAFSVPDGVRIPPSLRNIFKELHSDIGKEIPASGNLEHWAKQGVLMLNAVLTVEAGNPTSHQKRGWEEFTQAIIKHVSQHKNNLVFMLWGLFAQKTENYIVGDNNLILKSPHPSPYSASRGFLGNKHFSKCNEYLKNKQESIIIW